MNVSPPTIDHLRQLQRMELAGHLATGAAHDFNNALQVIAGCLDVIAQAPRDAVLVEAQMAVAFEALACASSVARQLATFGRPEADSRDYVDLNDLVMATARLMRPVAGSSISLSVSCESEPLCVWANRGQIEQALLNLCLNARDAMPSGGNLRLVTCAVAGTDSRRAHQASAGRFAIVEVSDTGTGIPPEMQPRIFEPYFTTKPLGKGTGLGLAMVQSIVRAHGGLVDFTSAVQAGTTFRLFLPVR